MNVRHTLICFLFLSLQDENTARSNAQITVYAGTEGGDVTVECPFSYSRSKKYFCREECRQKDVLIETTDDRHQRGRYSIKYTAGSLYVSITQLTKSDSGLYRCGLDITHSSYKQFRIIVVDAMLDENAPDVTTIHERPGGNVVVRCSFTNSARRKYFCKDECKEKDILVETTGVRGQKGRYSIAFMEGSSTGGSLYVSITQLTKSDSGRYACGLDRFLSSDSFINFNIIVADPTTSKPPPAFTRPSASTLPATTTHTLSTQSDQQLGGTTPSTAVTTPEPNWTHRPFTTSVPSASTPTATTTHTLSTQSDQQLGGTTPSTGVLLSVIVILVIAVIIMGLALMIICIQRKNRPDGLRTRGHSDSTNMEVYDYKNCPAVHNHEDSTYQSLNPATMDEDQTYSAPTHT